MLNDGHTYYMPNLHNFHMESIQTLLSMQNMWNSITFYCLLSSRCSILFPILPKWWPCIAHILSYVLFKYYYVYCPYMAICISLPIYGSYTHSVPNYLSDLIGTQILRNLWWICKNTQLGSNLSLNKFSKGLFYT